MSCGSRDPWLSTRVSTSLPGQLSLTVYGAKYAYGMTEHRLQIKIYVTNFIDITAFAIRFSFGELLLILQYYIDLITPWLKDKQ